jgi:hypothetical protein
MLFLNSRRTKGSKLAAEALQPEGLLQPNTGALGTQCPAQEWDHSNHSTTQFLFVASTLLGLWKEVGEQPQEDSVLLS